MARLVVVGSCNMDLVSRTWRFPRPGEHLVGTGFGTFLGGKGANQAVAGRRAGVPTRMVGRVGRDAFGDAIVAALDADGIDVAGIGRDATAPTGNASIWLDATGENQIVVYPGANGKLAPDVATTAMEPTGPEGTPDVLLMQLEVPMETVVASARHARARGMIVVLNAAPASELPDDAWTLVDVLVVNETEAAALSGGHPPEPAARALIERGCGAVVVTLGEAGCIVARASTPLPVRVEAFPATRVVDATGAGDAFCGTLAARLAEGADLIDAARTGNAAGSLAVEVLGAIPSMPSRAAIEAREASSRPRRDA